MKRRPEADIGRVTTSWAEKLKCPESNLYLTSGCFYLAIKLDASEILKHFKSDGTAVEENFSKILIKVCLCSNIILNTNLMCTNNNIQLFRF